MRCFCSSVQRLLADALAREVHDGVDALERGRVDQPRRRIPADVVAVGDAAPPQAQHTMPGPAAARRSARVPIRPLAPLITTSMGERYSARLPEPRYV